jgi:transcription antitermination protein NusB
VATTDPSAAKDAAAKVPAKPRSARRRAREFAVQALYQWLVSKEDGGAIEAHIVQIVGFDRADREHFRAILYGVLRDEAALHRAIEPHIDRPLVELSPVEHALLLIGSYELQSHLEIPYRVVINEAVELAKSYGGSDGYKYVNGVLDRVALSLRPIECGASRG